MTILVNDSNRDQVRGKLTERSIRFYDGTYTWDSDGFKDENGVYHRFDDVDDPEAIPPTPFPISVFADAIDANTRNEPSAQSGQINEAPSTDYDSTEFQTFMEGLRDESVREEPATQAETDSPLSECPSSISEWSVDSPGKRKSSQQLRKANLKRKVSSGDKNTSDGKSGEPMNKKKPRKDSKVAPTSNERTHSVKEDRSQGSKKTRQNNLEAPSGPALPRASSTDSGIGGIKIKRRSVRQAKMAVKK